METKEIKIEVPEGYEIDKDRSTFERIVFKEVKKAVTYKDIAASIIKHKESFWISSNGSIIGSKSIDSPEEPNNSSTKEQLESILALNKLCNVAKYLNGDWLPERSRGSYIKWFIGINYESLGGPESTLTIGKHNTVQYSIVYFKTKELAQQAITILGEEEIRKALTLNW